jgi:hypothetical protein
MAMFVTSGVGYLSNRSTTASPIAFETGGAERMRINASGNVGIGTSSPLCLLAVGDGSLSNAVMPIQINSPSASTNYIGLNKGGTYGGLLGYSNGGSEPTGMIIRTVPADPIVFITNNASERMRIEGGGNLLVGTTTARQSTNTIYSASNPACVFYRPISSIGAAITSFFSDVGGTATFKSFVDSSGSFTLVSDERYKKNIETLTTGLSIVEKLNPVSFNWKYEDDALPKTNGFIAQEVELIYPEAITTMDVEDSNGYSDQKMMKNDALIPVLVKAIQELKAEIDLLKGVK